jgi:hypothetical protein
MHMTELVNLQSQFKRRCGGQPCKPAAISKDLCQKAAKSCIILCHLRFDTNDACILQILAVYTGWVRKIALQCRPHQTPNKKATPSQEYYPKSIAVIPNNSLILEIDFHYCFCSGCSESLQPHRSGVPQLTASRNLSPTLVQLLRPTIHHRSISPSIHHRSTPILLYFFQVIACQW